MLYTILSLLQILYYFGVARATDWNAHALNTAVNSNFYGDNNAVIPVTASPKCWKQAITTLKIVSNPRSQGDATELCSILPETKQKLLAIEIARCHLQDVSRSMFRKQCAAYCHNTIDEDTMPYCLANLADAGVNAYTHYISYIQQLCIRLTQEVILEQQYQSQFELNHRYQDMAHQSLQQLESLHNLSTQYQSQMLVLAELPDQIEHQLTTKMAKQIELGIQLHLKQQLEEYLATEFSEQLNGQLQAIFQGQAMEYGGFVDKIIQQMQDRDKEQRERYENWAYSQSLLWQKQSRDLTAHREVLQTLSETVTSTTAKLQPLLGMETLIFHAATTGYVWLSFLLYLLVTFNLAWLVTIPTGCRRVRSVLYVVIILEALIEVLATIYAQRDTISETDRCLLVTELRRYAIAIECGVYVIGWITSCFVRSSGPKSIDDMHKLQEEAYRQLRAEVLNTSQLLVDSIHQQEAFSNNNAWTVTDDIATEQRASARQTNPPRLVTFSNEGKTQKLSYPQPARGHHSTMSKRLFHSDPTETGRIIANTEQIKVAFSVDSSNDEFTDCAIFSESIPRASETLSEPNGSDGVDDCIDGRRGISKSKKRRTLVNDRECSSPNKKRCLETNVAN